MTLITNPDFLRKKNRINLPVEMRRLILKALEDGMLHHGVPPQGDER